MAYFKQPVGISGFGERYIPDEDDDDDEPEDRSEPERPERETPERDSEPSARPAGRARGRAGRRGRRRSRRTRLGGWNGFGEPAPVDPTFMGYVPDVPPLHPQPRARTATLPPTRMRSGLGFHGWFAESGGPPTRVVLLPGIMGSRLVERRTGVPVWGDPAMLAAVAGGGLGLALWHRVMTSGDGISGSGSVAARGLTRLPRIDPYSAIVADLNHAFGSANVLPFSYDWRLSNETNASRLMGEIGLRWPDVLAGGARRVHLIGHSMGGLVARWFVERLGGARLVHTLTTVGTPHFGAPEAMTLLAATSFGFIPGHSRASAIPGLGAVVRAVSRMAKNWGSVAQLLPGFDFVVPRGATSPEPISATFARIRGGPDWAPIFGGSILRGPASRSIRNLNRGLIGGVAGLNATLSAAGVRYFHIATTNHSTVVQARHLAGPAVVPISAVCGDGTVPGSSAVLPAASNIVPLFRTSAQAHGDLFNDAAIRALCLSIVRGPALSPATGPACAATAPRHGLEGDSLGCGGCIVGEMQRAGLAEAETFAEADALAAPW